MLAYAILNATHNGFRGFRAAIAPPIFPLPPTLTEWPQAPSIGIHDRAS
jgi:hypothetical protein